MKKVILGKSGLEVTEIGFGGIPIIPLPEEDAIKVVRHCYDIGFRFFDTANMYRDSEIKIGKALKPVRKDTVIATKTAERDAKAASEHIDLSLKQLQTDYIDLFQLHNVSNEEAFQDAMKPGGAYEAAVKAKEAGKIRKIGVTSHNISVAKKACETGLFDTLQFPFNFIEHDPADDLFQIARKNDMGIIGMKPLGGGLLERADLCFGFLRNHPYVVPIPGIVKTEEADEILSLYENPKPLTDADLKEMEEIRSTLGAKFCHRCEYCMPCEQGVQIPRIMIFKPFVKRFSPKFAVVSLKDAMETVENCIECGECEQKCPYDLNISELIHEYHSLYRSYCEQ